MYSYGEASQRQKETCHFDLQSLLNEAIKYIDISVICGGRGCVKQMEYYHATPQRSQKVFFDSRHNPDFNSFNPEELALILDCQPTKESIQEAIKTAQLLQLKRIDEISTDLTSKAVDIMPWKPTRPHINWTWEKELQKAMTEDLNHQNSDIIKAKLYNIEEWIYFLGTIRGIAFSMGIPIRFGFDWNGNGLRGDQGFDDNPHIELI